MSPRLLCLLGVLVAAAACQEPPPSAPPSPTAVPRPAEARRYFGAGPDGKLHVYFFNVGQGDAALIVSPEGHTVLVDTGPITATDHLLNRLPELLTGRLDLVILTHPHPDHHGAVEAVLRRVGAKQLMEPQLEATPPEYDALLTRLGGMGVEFVSTAPSQSTPNAPLRLPLGPGVDLNVLWPRHPAEKLLDVPDAALEANSVVLRLTYGDTAVLFEGDAHAKTEEHLLERGMPMRATVLKVAAHGADGPTTEAFLKAVHPGAAVISVSGQSGGPASATLKRLEAAGVQVFRTDVAGEVQVVSDGKQLVVTPQRLPDGVPGDTRYTFAGLGDTASPPVAQVPKAEAAKAGVPKPEAAKAEAPKSDVTKASTGRGSQGPRSPTNPTQYGQVVDIDDLPSANVPPSSRTETRTPRKGTESRAMSAGPYVGSSKADVFHLPSCRNAAKIKESNLVVFKTREEAARNRRPARDCNP
ncbi:MBL fold metallo-hydrolase [Pyxidicoccus parkwayensis]|uniref:MBL fold metallo-hydrolase n=1 Tax=Pyxidicoccus parkwayensis TaxID=2813578 RepID=A0ABX7P1M2_9BACT|nr:MBL fold metallo-hydrolase [Pyxidicoccus parkwaysis]QSQ23911.1 MBL fold metallo-hydrolase [Pyxidicoccus parkwaysis]